MDSKHINYTLTTRTCLHLCLWFPYILVNVQTMFLKAWNSNYHFDPVTVWTYFTAVPVPVLTQGLISNHVQTQGINLNPFNAPSYCSTFTQCELSLIKNYCKQIHWVVCILLQNWFDLVLFGFFFFCDKTETNIIIFAKKTQTKLHKLNPTWNINVQRHKMMKIKARHRIKTLNVKIFQIPWPHRSLVEW